MTKIEIVTVIAELRSLIAEYKALVDKKSEKIVEQAEDKLLSYLSML